MATTVYGMSLHLASTVVLTDCLQTGQLTAEKNLPSLQYVRIHAAAIIKQLAYTEKQMQI